MKNAYEKLENIISSSGDSERGTGTQDTYLWNELLTPGICSMVV